MQKLSQNYKIIQEKSRFATSFYLQHLKALLLYYMI